MRVARTGVARVRARLACLPSYARTPGAAGEIELTAAQWADAFAHTPIGMAICRPDGRILHANHALAATTGTLRTTVPQTSVFDCLAAHVVRGPGDRRAR